MVQQANLFDDDYERALLDQLIEESKLYRSSEHYMKLLDFVVRLRNFAPFNAMLLHIQKPGLSYAALERDWRERFGRWPKEGARPLLILWPFGPVALVYDVMDTEGDPLPVDVASFFARGPIDGAKMESFVVRERKNIEIVLVDAGDRRAGSIQLIKPATKEKEKNQYRIIRSCREVGGNWAALAPGWHGGVDQAARSRSVGERSRLGQPSTRRRVI